VVEAQEVEPVDASCEMHDPRFLRVQAQPENVEDRRHLLAGLLGLRFGGAEDDEVVCVSDQHSQPLLFAARRCFVEHVQGDVGKQR
jgi:hypothetical protein